MSTGEFCPKCRKYYGGETWHCRCHIASPPPRELPEEMPRKLLDAIVNPQTGETRLDNIRNMVALYSLVEAPLTLEMSHQEVGELLARLLAAEEQVRMLREALENIKAQATWFINADEHRAFKICGDLAREALSRVSDTKEERNAKT